MLFIAFLLIIPRVSVALIYPSDNPSQSLLEHTPARDKPPDAVLFTSSSSRLHPTIERDFADPSIVQGPDGWYSFATSSHGVHVQSAHSKDFANWTLRSEDAMPKLPRWVNARNPAVWAPDVIRNDQGRYVLYFSASYQRYPYHHCIGVAVSDTITGPYTALSRPLICPDPRGIGEPNDPSIIISPGMGGAIDAAGFQDVDGSRYIVYKIDGNSLAGGGPCGNGGIIRRPTPIYLAKVGPDGIAPAGSPVQLLDRTDRDGPLIEAPSLARLADGSYALFYSSNCWNSEDYDISWARATSVTGPYTRMYTLLKSGMLNLKSPGGASMASDGKHMVFHAHHGEGRAMYAAVVGVV